VVLVHFVHDPTAPLVSNPTRKRKTDPGVIQLSAKLKEIARHPLDPMEARRKRKRRTRKREDHLTQLRIQIKVLISIGKVKVLIVKCFMQGMNLEKMERNLDQ